VLLYNSPSVQLSDCCILLYEICDLSSIQMSFMRNKAPTYRDKKIEHLCDVIFRSWVSMLINTKGCQTSNVLSCKLPSHVLIMRCCQPEQHICKKLPLYFLERSFWTLHWRCVTYYSFSVSSDLLYSLFWSMHIKTWCSSMKDHHCLKYTRLEHTVKGWTQYCNHFANQPFFKKKIDNIFVRAASSRSARGAAIVIHNEPS
jgi:hypothetical protein